MSRRRRLSVLSLSIALPLAFAGCEVTTCKDGEDCVDLDFPDGGDDEEMDATVGSDDGGTPPGKDSGTPPAPTVKPGDPVDLNGDGKSDGKAIDTNKDGTADGVDTNNDGTADELLPSGGISLDDFCTALLSAGTAWTDKFDMCCSSQVAGSTDVKTFLNDVLLYPEDAFAKCVAARKSPALAGKSRYEGTKAMACAAKFVAAFGSAPAECGFDLTLLEATIGHGAPSQRQIPECRAAFVGQLKQGQQCQDAFDCSGNLRCIVTSGSGSGATKTCEMPRAITETCAQNGDCDDGLTCVGGSASGGATCHASPSDLGGFMANCTRSSQCEVGRICSSAGKCEMAAASTAICK